MIKKTQFACFFTIVGFFVIVENVKKMTVKTLFALKVVVQLLWLRYIHQIKTIAFQTVHVCYFFYIADNMVIHLGIHILMSVRLWNFKDGGS